MTDFTQADADAAVADLLREQRAQTVVASQDSTPAQAADHATLAAKTGIPVGAVASNPDAVRTQVEQQDFNALAASSPTTAAWLSEQGNYALGKSSMPQMSELEKATADFNAQHGAWNRTTNLLAQTWNEWKLQGLGLSFAASQAVNDAREGLGQVGAVLGSVQASQGGPQAGMAAMQAGGAAAEARHESDMASTAAAAAPGIAATEQTIKAIPQNPASMAFWQAIHEGDYAKAMQAFKTAPLDIPSLAIAHGLASTAPQLGITALAPEAAPIVFGGTGFAQGLGEGPLEYLSQHGIDVTDPKALTAAMLDRDLMAKANDYGQKMAEVQGVVQMLIGGIAGKGLIPKSVITHRAIREAANQIVAQPAVQSLAQGAGTAASTYETTGSVDWGDVRTAALQQAFFAPFEGLSVGAKRIIGDLNLRSMQERQAQAQKAQLASLVAATEKTPLKGLSSAAYESYMGRLAPEGMVYVKPEALAALYQSANTDLATGLDRLDAVDAYSEAVSTGTDVGIPVEKYLARLDAKQHEALAEHAYYAPNGETHDAGMLSKDEISQVWADVLKSSKDDEARDNGSAGQVYDAIYGQLLGSHGEATAAQQASVAQAFYRTVGERTGVDPMALYERFPLNINGSRVEAPKPGNTDLAVDPLIEAAHAGAERMAAGKEPDPFSERDIHGPSLIAQVIAGGGIDPKSVGAGDLKAADANKLRPGLLNKKGITVEKMAEQIAEDPGWAGVFTTKDEYGRPDYRELVDLIRQELGGQPVHSQASDFRIQQEIDRKLAFNEATRTMRQAFEKHEAATGEQVSSLPIQRQRELARAAFHDPESDALYQPADGGAPRGQITFDAPDAMGRRQINISLNIGKDRSTFLHEGAHAFMEIMGHLANDEGATDSLKADFDTLMRFAGAAGKDAGERLAWWHDQPIEVRRGAHEKLARGFEQYLFEGKAPSSSLRRAFASFKVWMLNIYRSLSKLGAPINDDVRQVFDRMLASDDEIAAAKNGLRSDPLVWVGDTEVFPAEEMARIKQAFADANADATTSLTAQLLRSETAAQKAMIAEERKTIRDQVEAETRQHPVYKAIRWLRNAKHPDGSEAPKVKLSKESLLTEYGPEWIKKNLHGMYAAEGGMSADEAADLMGYSSGSEMIKAVADAVPLHDFVKAETESRLKERFPDPMVDGSLPDRALAAVHRDKQFSAILLEVRALERKTTGQAKTNGAILREVAKQLIAEKIVRKMDPNTYRVAEAKAGKEAFEAAGKKDYTAALAARRRQLLNGMLYRAARDAKAEAARAQKTLQRFTKNKVRAKLGKAGFTHLDQIDNILARFDVRPMSAKAAERRANLADWITSEQDAGRAVAIPESVQNEAFRKPIQDLTLSELRDVRDAVKNLAHLADLKNTLLLGKERRDRKAVDAAVGKSISDGSGKHPRADNRGDPEWRDKVRHAFMEGRGLIGAPAELVAEMEGFHEGGALTEHVITVIRDAVFRDLDPELRKANDASGQLWLDHYSPKELRTLDRKIWIPELGENWSKRRILNLLQNWGNEGNRKAILSQANRRLTTADVAALFKHLDARDGKFMQARWDYMNTHFPALDEATRRRTGLPLKKVEASAFAFEGKDGQVSLRGGYFPLKYEPQGSVKAAKLIEDEYEKLISGGTSKPKVQDGQTIARVGSGGNIVDLTIDHFDGSIRDTLRLIHLADAVNYVHQVLHGPETGEAFRAAKAMEYHARLKEWLKDVAAGEMGPRNSGERFLRYLRGNVITAHLGLSPLKWIAHVGGLFVSSARLGPAAMLTGIRRYTESPFPMTRYIHDASAYMKQREGEISEAVRGMSKASDPLWKRTGKGLRKAAIFPLVKIWSQIERITWLAAESKGLGLFKDVQKARDYADGVVAGTQGASEFIEKSALRRGTLHGGVKQSETIKALTTMMSYMSAKQDLLYRLGYIAHRDSKGFSVKTAKAVMKLTGGMLMICTMDGLAYSLAQQGIPQNPTAWFQQAASASVDESVGAVPIVGHPMSAMIEQVMSLMGGEPPHPFEPKTPYETTVNDFGALVRAATSKKFNTAAVERAGLATIGDLTGMPTSQINKIRSAIEASDKGREVGPMDYLTGYRR